MFDADEEPAVLRPSEAVIDIAWPIVSVLAITPSKLLPAFVVIRDLGRVGEQFPPGSIISLGGSPAFSIRLDLATLVLIPRTSRANDVDEPLPRGNFGVGQNRCGDAFQRLLELPVREGFGGVNSSGCYHAVLAIHLARLLRSWNSATHPARPPARRRLMAFIVARVHCSVLAGMCQLPASRAVGKRHRIGARQVGRQPRVATCPRGYCRIAENRPDCRALSR